MENIDYKNNPWPGETGGLLEDRELMDWFYIYYIKWMETCENQRWMQEGRQSKYPTSLLPFVPFGGVSSEPYFYWLTTFVASQICRQGPMNPHPLGNQGHMATLVFDAKPAKGALHTTQCPYIMFEWVYGGVITQYRMFSGDNSTNWNGAKAALAAAGEPSVNFNDIVYTKFVTYGFLKRVHTLHKQWLLDGDNPRYMIGLVRAILEGIKKGYCGIDPEPTLLKNINGIQDTNLSSGLADNIEFWDALHSMAEYIPNITFVGRGGKLPLDMGSKYTLEIDESGLWALTDGLKLYDTLPELFSFLIAFAGRGLAKGWINFKGIGWVSKIMAFYLRNKIHGLSSKAQILTKIMGNPFRLLLVANEKAIALTLKEGLPERVEYIELQHKDGDGKPVPLDQLWLKACENRPFLQLAVRVKPPADSGSRALKSGIDFSIQDRIEFYPKNDFVKYLLRKGALQIGIGLMVPFLEA